MEFEEGDVVLCTVEKIEGTVVFVNIDGTNKQGTIITSEVAPGRIRNIREYVVPKKKIVCKIIRLEKDKINLSLRRVTKKEQKEVLDKIKQEKSHIAVFNTVLGKEEAKKILEQITEKESLSDFVEEAKKNSKELEKIIGKEKSEKILEILKKQKTKSHALKKQLNMKTNDSEGIILIKEILQKINKAKIKYISAGKYSIEVEAESPKEADQKLKEVFEEIEKKSKNKFFDISLTDSKSK